MYNSSRLPLPHPPFRAAGDDDAVTGEDKIFLTDITARKIYVADLGIYTFTALNEDDDPIEAWDIAFDEINQKLYWTSKADNKIYRGNWDMTERIPVSHGNYSGISCRK